MPVPVQDVQRYAVKPAGQFYNLYKTLSDYPHLLIAGATGSGKSVILNGIIYQSLLGVPMSNSDEGRELYLCDPKRVELSCYKAMPHVAGYASNESDIATLLNTAVDEMNLRYRFMEEQGLRQWKWGQVHIVIDEWADLMVTNKKNVLPPLQRLTQLGRAAGFHVVLATQCPLAKIIPTEVKVNFTHIMGLHTATAQHSRNIVGIKGCESLPMYGKGMLQTPEGIYKINIPMTPEKWINKVTKYWNNI